MARKRMIDPAIWDDPNFNKMSPEGRLAFIGMISNADDYGYIRGDLGSLKRLIFGFDNDLDNAWYKQLEKFKNLHFYEVDGEIIAHLLNWNKYQKQHKDRVQDSLFPPCTTCRANDGQPTAEVSSLSRGSSSSNGATLKEKWEQVEKRKKQIGTRIK